MQLPERTAQKIAYSVDTTEDYMSLTKPPVADGLKGRFVAVQRPVDPTDQEELEAGHGSITELLTVTPPDASGKERLLHLQHDHSSDSGWRSVEVDLPDRRLGDSAELSGPIQQISAFYQAGRIHALLHYTDPTGDGRIVLPMLYNVSERRWTEWDLRDGVDDEGYDIYRGGLRNALAKTKQTGIYRTSSGIHVFYGVSTSRDDDAFFVVFEDEYGEWQAASETVPSADSTYRIVSAAVQDYETAYSILRFDGNQSAYARDVVLSYDEGAYDYRLDWQQEGESPSFLGLGDVSAAEVTPLPAAAQSDNVIVQTAEKNLVLVSGFKSGGRPFIRHLTGGPGELARVNDLTIGADRFGRAMLFATNAVDDKLWLLRQDSLGDDGTVRFGSWVCLGNHVAAMSAPRAMLDGAELFLVRTNDRTLEHIVQTPLTTVWHSAELAVAHHSTADPKKISAHSVELIALDEHGAPVPDAALEIFSTHAAGVSIDGISHRANPIRPIKVTTDRSGRLGVKMKADSLTSPHLQVVISANQNRVDIQPDSRIAERLEAKDPRFKVDAPSLRKAGLIPENATDSQAGVIAQMTRKVGETLKAQHKGRGVPSADEKAFEFAIDRRNPRDPQITKDTQSRWGNVANVNEAARQLPTSAPSVRSSGLSGFLGDLLHRLKHAWDEVTKVVVRAAEGAVRFIIHVGEAIHDFVVDTAHGIATAFEALFSFVADVFGKASDIVKGILNFVTALFDWEQIAAVNDLLNKSVTGYLDGVEEFIRTKIAPGIGKTIDDARDKLDESLAKLEESVGGLSLEGGQLQSDSPHTGNMSKADRLAAGNMVQGRFAHRHASANKQTVMEKAGSYEFGEDDDIAAVLEDFGKQLAGSANKNFVETGEEILTHFQNCNSAADVFNGGFSVLIHATRGILRFTLDLTKEILVSITRIAAIMVKWINSLLQMELPIPVLDHLFRKISGRGLQVLDLFTFGLAIPTAVVAGLVNPKNGRIKQENVDEVHGTMKNAFSYISMPEVGADSVPDKPEAPKAEDKKPSEKGLRIAAGILAIAMGVMEYFFKPIILSAQHAIDAIPDEADVSAKISFTIQAMIWAAKFLYYATFLPITVIRVVFLMITAKKTGDNSTTIEAFIEEAFSIATIVASIFGMICAFIAFIIYKPLKLGVYAIYLVLKLRVFFSGITDNTVVAFDANPVRPADVSRWKTDAIDSFSPLQKIASGFLTISNMIIDLLLFLFIVALSIWILVVNIQQGATAENWLADIALTVGSLYMLLSFVPPLFKWGATKLMENPYTAVPMVVLFGACLVADEVCPKVSGVCNIAIGSIELGRL